MARDPMIHPASTTAASDVRTTLAWEMIEPLRRWLEHVDLKSFDWWDLWATRIGGRAKRLYVRHRTAGTMAVAPLLALDLVFPGLRRFFAERRPFPICHAHMGLGYLNLWALGRQAEYLARAEGLVEPLLAMASPQARGLGWGMNLDWETIGGLIPRDTPCNTQTAYVYEFFAQLHEATGKEQYRSHLERIAAHVAGDFPEWWRGDALACSYSTLDDRRVVNANSYRMLILLDAGVRLGKPECSRKGLATLRYVLSMQRPDGSWPYAEDEPFVDTYHTCFILKNLHKVRSKAGDLAAECGEALQRGLRYYLDHLFDERGYLVPFAIRPRLVLHRYEAYDLAESIGLLADLDIEPQTLDGLLRFARHRFQTREGWFIFRLYPFGSVKGIPYVRGANSAMFLALTKVLQRSGGQSAVPASGSRSPEPR